jgi:hypothetical protein
MIIQPADDYLVGSKRDAYAEYNSEYVFPITPALPSCLIFLSFSFPISYTARRIFFSCPYL